MMLRSFIAVKIPTDIQSALASSLAPLQKALPKPLVRWVVPQNIHLTLKFLGDVSPANLELLAEALSVESAAHEALLSLLRSIETVAAKHGYTPEERPFSPHLTIGRVGQNISGMDQQRISTAVEGMIIGTLGTFRVEAVHIFKSDLQPGGPVYKHLYLLPLKST
jgi:2'-5' RNA ligase